MNIRTLFIALLLLSVASASGISLWHVTHPSNSTTHIGGDFTLTNAATEQNFDSKHMRGKYLLVYFGYSFCPDVCPTGLTHISAALSALPPTQRTHIVPIFITLDPVRDTPQALKSYIANFDPAIIALTGKPEHIAAVAKAYGVYFKSQQKNPADLAYAVDHSSYIYVMDEHGDYLSHFGHSTTADIMAKKLSELLPK